jgi:hypothetical protein
VEFAVQAMTHTMARFVSDSDGNYKLHSDSLKADLGVGMTLSQIAAATKGDSNFDSDLKQHISDGKITKEDAQKLTNASKSDITWSVSGSFMVPSTVDLYYATDDQFTQRVTAQYVMNEARYANYAYNTPATASMSSDARLIEADIGTIVASMIPWEAQSVVFRAHYVPADGRPVDQGTQYFALVNRQRLTPQSSPNVKVPDLRGEFLRGLNNFDSNVSPAQVDPFEQESKRARVAGELEHDAIKRQHLTLNSLKQFKSGGDFGTGDHIPIPADRVTDYQHLDIAPDPDVVYSTETRPTNVAVYYYVRVN